MTSGNAVTSHKFPFVPIAVLNAAILRALVTRDRLTAGGTAAAETSSVGAGGGSGGGCRARYKTVEKKVRREFTVILLVICASMLCLSLPYFVVWCRQYLQSRPVHTRSSTCLLFRETARRYTPQFLLPRCMHCMQRGLAMRKLFVCPSVRLSNAWIAAKGKKVLPRFLYHTKDHLSQFAEKKNGWWGRPLPPEIYVKLTPLERNRRFSICFRS